MFSSEHARLWQALPAQASLPPRACLSILESAAPFDPRIPDLLFTDRSGDIEEFDARLLDFVGRLKGRHIEIAGRLLERSGGGIVGLSAEAFDEADCRRMVDAGLTFSVLWQETCDRERYTQLHSAGTRKAGFEYRLNAYQRMIAGGIGEAGALTGIIGTPRLKPAPRSHVARHAVHSHARGVERLRGNGARRRLPVHLQLFDHPGRRFAGAQRSAVSNPILRFHGLRGEAIRRGPARRFCLDIRYGARRRNVPWQPAVG